MGIIFVVVLMHGVEIIVKFGKRSRDQFVKDKRFVKMEHAHKRPAHVNAKKDGKESFVINERIKENGAQPNHSNKIEVYFSKANDFL